MPEDRLDKLVADRVDVLTDGLHELRDYLEELASRLQTENVVGDAVCPCGTPGCTRAVVDRDAETLSIALRCLARQAFNTIETLEQISEKLKEIEEKNLNL